MKREEIVTSHVIQAWQQTDSPHWDVGNTVRNRDRENFIRLFQITTMGRSFLIGFKREKIRGFSLTGTLFCYESVCMGAPLLRVNMF